MRLRLWLAAWIIVAFGWAAPSWGAPAGWPASLTIGTGSPGGVYLPYGRGLAPILSKALGIPVTTQATQGPDQNVLLLESGEVQLGFVTMGVALEAWNGTGKWTHGKKLRAMRALFPMYDTPLEFVADPSSGIKSLADFAGKRIGVGPQGGTCGTYMPLIDKTLNIPAILRYGSWDTHYAQMRSHLLDGVAVCLGVPAPFISKLDAAGPLRFIAPSDAEIAALRKAMSELGVSVVPPGTYPSQKGEYRTIGLFNFAVVTKDLPDDLVNAILKAFYANHDRMVKVNPSAKESVVANVKRDEFLPFHPGAVRYYRDVGVAIPAALISAQ
jgi:TRAP transporter TAXI family solute receptor